MALPKIEYPIFLIEQPSTKRKLKFRPMLVKEEKILLIAKSSEEDTDILLSVKQIIQNCCLEENFDVEKITFFDMQYFFIQLRANSINNIVTLKYLDTEDNQEYSFEVDLKHIEVKFPEKLEMNIKINEDTGFLMKYAEASIYNDTEFMKLKDENEIFLRLISKSVDKIYDKEKNYDSKDYSEVELISFIENLNINILQSLREFLDKQPYIKHTIRYKNSKGTEREINLTTLNDFFTFR